MADWLQEPALLTLLPSLKIMVCHGSSARLFSSYFLPMPCSGESLGQNLAAPSPNPAWQCYHQTDSPKLLWSTVFTLGSAAARALSTQCIFWTVKIHVVSLGGVAHPTAARPKHSSHTGLWKQHCRSGSAGCWYAGSVGRSVTRTA